MPNRVRITWAGVEELKKTYAAVGGSLDDRNRALKQVILPVVNTCVDNAKSLAPVKTGNLRNSMYATMGSDRQRGVLFGVRSRKAPYGVFVEYGTGKMTAQPFFRPALVRMLGSYVTDITPGVQQLIETTAAANAYTPSN